MNRCMATNQVDEIEKFLETQKLQKPIQEEIENLNIPMTKEIIESVSKNLPTKEIPGPVVFTGEFQQTFKEELKPVLLNPFKKVKEEGILRNSSYETSSTLIVKPDKDITRRENYRPISHMSLVAKILNKILATESSILKGLYTIINWDLSQEYKHGSIYENQSI